MGALIDPRIPAAARPLLVAYMARLDERLPGLLDGFYVHGSIALGAFDPRRSDLDFVATVTHPLTERDLDGLREVHPAVAKQFKRPPMDGCYLQPSDLGCPAAEIAPHPQFNDGRFNPAARGDINFVTWWLLLHGSLTLRGPAPDFTVDQSALLAEMRQNLNSYWLRWPESPVHQVWLLTDAGVAWAVLGPLRQFYTFKEGGIVSKTAAGEYALAHLPDEWQPIVCEALRCREGAGKSHYRSRIRRANEALRFVPFAVDLCNSLF